MSMSIIKPLPDNVINQIAAGEVIDRPASVVKELVENAIDAGATNIEIMIEDGGKRLIRVIDNGKGMDEEDLRGAVKRHWTSKIGETEDITRIQSFGFRGEALASIAAVSKFKISSRVAGSEYGYEIAISGGAEEKIKKVGMPLGTQVNIENLFYNLPAREKFLRATRTEFGYIQELIQQFALVKPRLSFKLVHNGKTVFTSIGNKDGVVSKDLLKQVLGEELSGGMLEAAIEMPHLRVKGWIGRPGYGNALRARQLLFVNSRMIESRVLWNAVREGYGSVIGRQEKPQFVIMLEIEPHLIDVNIHPQKKEVKFITGNVVYQGLTQMVRRALDNFQVEDSRIVFSKELFQPGTDDVSSKNNTQSFRSFNLGQSSPLRPDYGMRHVNAPLRNMSAELQEKNDSKLYDSLYVDRPQVFQLMDLFIVEEGRDYIYVYDQHAVHERVLYSKFVQEFRAGLKNKEIQRLLIPLSLELDEKRREDLIHSRSVLEGIGFEFNLSPEKVELIAVPKVLAHASLTEVLNTFLADLENSEDLESIDGRIDNQTHRALAYLSCRSAIKAGDRLHEEQIRDLLVRFRAADDRYTCPHGRPVMVKITRKEMEGWFRR
jgi:DNA mismatch repair protein MutL